jgi:hypothetical protein
MRNLLQDLHDEHDLHTKKPFTGFHDEHDLHVNLGNFVNPVQWLGVNPV